MDLIKEVEAQYLKKKFAKVKAGDVVKIYQKIKEGNKERIQIFEGIVIKTHGGDDLSGTFTVRRVTFGIGIERTFPLHSPTIIKVERTKSIAVRRSRLYFLRDVIGKKAKKRKELKEFELWEEPEAEKEEEKLKAELEAEAKAKEEDAEKKKEELDKKFTDIRGEAVEPKEKVEDK